MEASLTDLQFTAEDRWNLYSLMAGILNLGNVDIDAVEATDGAVVSPGSMGYVSRAAELLGVSHIQQRLVDGIQKDVKMLNGTPTDFNYSQVRSRFPPFVCFVLQTHADAWRPRNRGSSPLWCVRVRGCVDGVVMWCGVVRCGAIAVWVVDGWVGLFCC